MVDIFNTLSEILSTFGASVLVPVMLFIIAKLMGVNNKKAFTSGLLCAVGLTGFNLVINSYGAIISPVVTSMSENAGVNLPILDTGWQSTSVIAYSTNIGLIFFGLAIFIQVGLFFLKWTNVFMPSDLWNNYSFMVWGSMLYLLTNNIWLALLLMIVQNLYILLFSEVAAKRWSTYYQYPKCCMTAPHHLETLPFAVLMNIILGKLGFNKIKLNAQELQKKFGIFGEPMFIGLLIGALIAIIGGYNKLGELATWGTITTSAISTASVMAVFPKVAGIFASAFTTLTDAYKSKAKQSGKEREWYMSVNDAVGYGEPNTLVTGIILIPIMLGIAFILPGNQTLPMIDLLALPYMVEVFVAISNGNIAKSIVSGVIWFSLGLLICSEVAPYFTQVATQVNPELTAGGLMIISFGIMAHPLIALSFLAFLTQNPLLIIGIIVLYFVLHFTFKKYKVQIVDFLERCNEDPNQIKSMV
ncbi:PTS galactitol transporter subunit IIC [Alkalibaculum sp. M08DMB]|uniref:PTS galactitol transporter subunit IIC n=1 Tax=Alkalibaculum sporogenes TaxID=2655001 RepID=A0A6A7K9R6_9FIRM|nr:PTS transporter subunit IIC [Alkalibaculum sporogenes]MPW26136.1 PTS galactitol transporter subunit IIC [Alkalibaculum sporogenes]